MLGTNPGPGQQVEAGAPHPDLLWPGHPPRSESWSKQLPLVGESSDAHVLCPNSGKAMFLSHGLPSPDASLHQCPIKGLVYAFHCFVEAQVPVFRKQATEHLAGIPRLWNFMDQ